MRSLHRTIAVLFVLVFTGSAICAVVCPQMEMDGSLCPEHGKPDCCHHTPDGSGDRCTGCMDTHFFPSAKHDAVQPMIVPALPLQATAAAVEMFFPFSDELISIAAVKPSQSAVLRI